MYFFEIFFIDFRLYIGPVDTSNQNIIKINFTFKLGKTIKKYFPVPDLVEVGLLSRRSSVSI